MIIVKMMVKIQKRTINSSKIHKPLAQGLVYTDSGTDGVDGKTYCLTP